ncbi:cyanophycinase [Massilia sp. Root418]|jgi:cyanophycinase|uniref:cyanophycinase n=1 Tax=Massilia sp. Root418 TaxID=1736532 RepID=UPI0006F77A83|nr:cyanophycinase [Massilia sp. Root418]KQW93489.1 cyanophycinase [Massilia sp. Root418]
MASPAPLLVIGGHEDRRDNMEVLRRFVELAGGPEASIAVLTAASSVPERVWDGYRQTFAALGAANCRHIHTPDRAAAEDGALAETVAAADGIFLTGGDQKRLLGSLGGTALERAIHQARAARGACLAGTSAGASAMSALMLAEGQAELRPEKGAISLGAGFALLQGVVIDQHFSERRRLARLLSVVAQNPQLLGIGIDEDTALLISPGESVEVLGEGAVTVLDGHAMSCNIADIGHRSTPEMLGVVLHLLPAGSRHDVDGAPAPLQPLMRVLAGGGSGRL